MKLWSAVLFCFIAGSMAQDRPKQEIQKEAKETPPPESEQVKISDLAPLKLATTCKQAEIDLVFVIDASGSIGYTSFGTCLTFLQTISDGLGVSSTGTHVGVVKFTSYATNGFYLNAYTTQTSLDSAIQRISYPGGGTYIAAGMNYALQRSFSTAHGDRADVPDVMVVITDGQDGRTGDVRLAYTAAHARGITVLAIGVGGGVKRAELLAIAGGNSSHVFDVANFNDLSSIASQICEDIDDADDDVCDPDPCNGHGSCATNGAEFACTCEVGYSGGDCGASICLHGGSLMCVCPFGWTGAHCETPINYCQNTTILYEHVEHDVPVCGAHGICMYDLVNGTYCKCQPGWTGIWCEEREDPCLSAPCLNGGTCLDNGVGLDFTCICDEFHNGTTCETPINMCKHLDVMHQGVIIQLHPCGEHGTCLPTAGGGILCLCDAGWNGTFCEHEILKPCTWTNGKVYPHNTTWIDGCNTYVCEYGLITESKAFWCPQRCALYNTTQTQAHGLPDFCPPNQNCIPDEKECAKPRCDYPIGWCMPVGMVMVDTITLPTNPPNGYKTFARKRK